MARPRKYATEAERRAVHRLAIRSWRARNPEKVRAQAARSYLREREKRQGVIRDPDVWADRILSYVKRREAREADERHDMAWIANPSWRTFSAPIAADLPYHQHGDREYRAWPNIWRTLDEKASALAALNRARDRAEAERAERRYQQTVRLNRERAEADRLETVARVNRAIAGIALKERKADTFEAGLWMNEFARAFHRLRRPICPTLQVRHSNYSLGSMGG